MKKRIRITAATAVMAALAWATPAFAQLGGIGKNLKRAQQVQDLHISDKEEHALGANVSQRIRARFGVVQDKAVHKYVASVGLVLAAESDRPGLPWTFIVLDTDGVNAFASPGGFVHITRGALALIENEAELAGVLGHEMIHVTEKHTVNAIKKNKLVQVGASEAGGDRVPLVDLLAGKVYEMVIENSFDRGDERESDEKGLKLAVKAGYAGHGLADFLARLADRNKGQKERNGLFASHPETNERIAAIQKQARAQKTTALVAARYQEHITYEPTPLTDVPQAIEGSAGLAGGSSKAAPAEGGEQEEAAPAEPKKRGFGLGSLKKTVAPEQQTAQVSASGGARGVGPDRNAKGGPNPALVAVNVNAEELSAFKKGIA
jgi:beta-barrel assembly-enhancing protease